MKQKETLHLIRARCVELLKQAKLRTPGRWYCAIPTGDTQRGDSWIELSNDDGLHRATDDDEVFMCNASVAFEAALESTIAAVDGLLATCDGFRFPDEDRPTAWKAINRIIAAWQHLLP